MLSLMCIELVGIVKRRLSRDKLFGNATHLSGIAEEISFFGTSK